MNRTEPLPCPFCGRIPEVDMKDGAGAAKWHVHCDWDGECPVNVFCFGPTREQAVGKWNRRK